MTYNEEQEQKHQLWKERISEYESSGLSIPAWCYLNMLFRRKNIYA